MERSQKSAGQGRSSEAIIAELGRSYVAMVSDALDRLGFRYQVLEPGIVPLGSSRIVGRAFPIVVAAADRLPEQPYAGEMRAVEALQPGEVLVYGGGQETRAAVFGELFAYAAMGRGATGAIVDGYIRDSYQLLHLGYSVFCRGTSPLDTLGRAEVVACGEQTSCGGVQVRRGDYILADQDGVAVIPARIAERVVASMPHKARDEQGARTDLKAGVQIREVWDRWKAF